MTIKLKLTAEKYKQFLEKCKKPNNDFYHKNKKIDCRNLKIL